MQERDTIPDWVSDFPRAICLFRKDEEYRNRVLEARGDKERSVLVQEAARRFPITPADVLALQAELED